MLPDLSTRKMNSEPPLISGRSNVGKIVKAIATVSSFSDGCGSMTQRDVSRLVDLMTRTKSLERKVGDRSFAVAK
jgi:hypothetical protein